MDNPTCNGISIGRHGGLYTIASASSMVCPPCRNLRDALYYFALYVLPTCTTTAAIQEYTDAVVRATALWGQESPPQTSKTRFPLTAHRARVRYYIGGRPYHTERTVTPFDDGSAECVLQSRQVRLRMVDDGLYEEVRSVA